MIEHVILGNLIEDEDYTRAVLPYLKDEYFPPAEVELFKIIKNFVTTYNGIPTKEAIGIELSKNESLNEEKFKDVVSLLEEIAPDPNTNKKFLVDETEKFCQDRALINALRRSITIVDDPKTGDKGTIPKLLQDALAVSFSSSVGHDYFEDWKLRYDEYHSVKSRLSFNVDLLNTVLKGGMLPSTTMILIAPTGVGKSAVMCNFAAHHLLDGKNVLYFTMEMSDIQISQRIDQNLIDMTEEELIKLPLDMYEKRVARLKDKSKSKLVVKGFPSGAASAAHFRYIIEELKLKKNFVPDVVYIDYLNICASSRMKIGGSINSYNVVKSVAEEIRGLGQEYGFRVITATQTNRNGVNNSDIELTDTSESMGITHTADYMLALISSEEYEELGQIMIKQLKNRFGDLSKYRRFVVGFDRARMKLYNVEQETQDDVADASDIREKPVMDETKFGSEDYERTIRKPKFAKFEGFR